MGGGRARSNRKKGPSFSCSRMKGDGKKREQGREGGRKGGREGEGREGKIERSGAAKRDLSSSCSRMKGDGKKREEGREVGRERGWK